MTLCGSRGVGPFVDRGRTTSNPARPITAPPSLRAVGAPLAPLAGTLYCRLIATAMAMKIAASASSCSSSGTMNRSQRS